ncbi:MAG: FKBP-type peptidyl-prolyl cis-trans isomerase [Candidatus Sumerlaeota bacterium]|nr:FKBP-type peptidyl-prolyl cis-trans isomerase [Candidatus Sumerlaeota bacterium]
MKTLHLIMLAMVAAQVSGFCQKGFSGETTAPVASATEGATVTLTGGVKYTDMKTGSGAEATGETTISIHYIGCLENGKVFEHSRDRIVPLPLTYVPKMGSVIDGLEQGVKGMRVGGRRVIFIPSGLAYGAAGRSPHVPPNTNLIFDVELVSVK